MGWKNWPYWLRGGIIVLILSLVIFFVGIVLVEINLTLTQCRGECVRGSTVVGIIGLILFSVFAWPMMAIHNGDYIIIGFILSVLQLFIIGAIIGFIIGKLKSKNVSKKRK